jgi:hypothetical protein
MKRFVFHIGYAKTATTFLQDQVFSNIKDIFYFGKRNGALEDELLQQLYLRMIEPFMRHNSLYGDKQFDFDFFPAYIASGKLDRDVDSFCQRLCKVDREKNVGKHQVLVFSDEAMADCCYFNGKFNTVMLERITEKLRDLYGGEVCFSFIFSIREQLDLLKSAFADGFKRHGKRFGSFERFIAFPQNYPAHGAFATCKYDGLFEALIKAFGKENIHCLLFEELKEDRMAFVAQILSILKSETVLPEAVLEVAKNKNSDARGKILRHEELGVFAKTINCFGGMYRVLVEIFPVIGSVKWIPRIKQWARNMRSNNTIIVVEGRLSDVSDKTKDFVTQYYGDSNERLFFMLNKKFSSYGYCFNLNEGKIARNVFSKK